VQNFQLNNKKTGSVEVICGCMFSGKTKELIKKLNVALNEGLNVAVFSPAIDTRHGENILVSHDSDSIPSTAVENSLLILSLAANADVVGIDEAQFFDDGLPDVCNQLADRGVRVIVSGLDMDFKRRPFGPVPALMATADAVTKLQAVCACCGESAMYSYRLVHGDTPILLGGQKSYEARCRDCY
jgi:thymidine kinase